MKTYNKDLLMTVSKTTLTVLQLEPNILEFSLVKICIQSLKYEFKVSTKDIKVMLKILEGEKLITSSIEFEVKIYKANKTIDIDTLEINLKQSILRSINQYRNMYKHKFGDVRLIQRELKKHLRECNDFKEAFETICNFKNMYKFDICTYYEGIPLGTIEFIESSSIDCWYYMSKNTRHFKNIEAFINGIYLITTNNIGGIFINYRPENYEEFIHRTA